MKFSYLLNRRKTSPFTVVAESDSRRNSYDSVFSRLGTSVALISAVAGRSETLA